MSANEAFDDFLKRIAKLEANGVSHTEAFEIVSLEQRLTYWPKELGNRLPFVIYGDFQIPVAPLELPTIGIRIDNMPTKDVFKHASCALPGTVEVVDRSTRSILDGIARINRVLGSMMLIGWGNSAIKWHCWLLCRSNSSGLVKIDEKALPLTVERIANLPLRARQKVDSALYWIRKPRELFYDRTDDTLAVYAGYWNAFECLVDAVCEISPPPKLGKTERQKQLDEYISQRQGGLTAEDITHCYQTFVNPGLVGRASHALTVCFGSQAGMYIDACFKRKPRRDRLYDIRNAINHGDIDADNPHELARVEDRLCQLWLILWRVFGAILPFGSPADDGRYWKAG